MLFGHLSVFLTTLGIAVLIMLENKVALFVMANVYCFVYNISNQAVGFLYLNEISTDIAITGVFVTMMILFFFQSTFFFDTLDLLTN